MNLKRWLAAAAAGGAATLGVGLAGLPAASAATTPLFPGSAGVAGYGWDGNANLVVQGGSDTTYKVSQALSTLYDTYAQNNQCQTSKNVVAVGANPVYPQTTPVLNQCQSQTTPAWANSNYDADTMTQAYPAGSSAGIASVNAQSAATGFNVANPGKVIPYEGTNQTISDSASTTDNGFGAIDMARSSRAPTTSGSSTCNQTFNGNTNNELGCDTWWGYAEDGIQVITFRNTSGAACSGATNCSLPSTAFLSAADLLNIYDGTDTRWSQVADLGITPNSPQDGPIVPWAMNSASGTFGTMNSYILDEAPSEGAAIPSGWTGVDDTVAGTTKLIGGAANPQNVRSLASLISTSNPLGSNNLNPFENDVKPILTDAAGFADDRPAQSGVGSSAAGLSTDNNSTQNPYNWIWFGSFGLMNGFVYQGSPTLSLTYQAGLTIAPPTQPQTNITLPIGIRGVTGSAIKPSTGTILANSYPIGRTLFNVTLKSDADCPLNTTSNACDFTGPNAVTNPNGGAELNVGTNTIPPGTGTFSSVGSTGKGGAVREYTRWLCRTTAENASPAFDPYSKVATGTTYAQDISASLTGSSFTAVPTALRSPGSSCDVFSFSYPALPPTFH